MTPPSPLKTAWGFFELGVFLKRNDPLKIHRNKLNMKYIGTKSVNMSDIMVYLAMFSTIIDQILCFWVLIRWKWAIIFQSLIPPNFELFPTETWDFFDFSTTPPPPKCQISKFRCFFDWKASLIKLIKIISHYLIYKKNHHYLSIIHDQWSLKEFKTEKGKIFYCFLINYC